MAPLIGETIAFVIAPGILIAQMRRFGAGSGSLRYPAAAGIVIVLVLGTLSIGNVPASWHLLDLQRHAFRKVTPSSGRAACTRTHDVDVDDVGWLGQHIPVRERFYFRSARPVLGASACIRFLLLPRLQVQTPAEARYLVFWHGATPAQLALLRSRRATLYRRGPHVLARLP